MVVLPNGGQDNQQVLINNNLAPNYIDAYSYYSLIFETVQLRFNLDSFIKDFPFKIRNLSNLEKKRIAYLSQSTPRKGNSLQKPF